MNSMLGVKRAMRWRNSCRACVWAGTVAVLAGLALAPAASALTVDHRAWDDLVKRYVDDSGRVAYRQLQNEAAESLQTYLDALAAVKAENLPRSEGLAFWINAYNALIVAAVLDGYGADNAFRRYRMFKGYTRLIAGRERSADDIEHKIIRPLFGDSRAHFALVCASSSCPFLRREAYTGDQLDAQLNDQGRRFLNEPSRNRIDVAAQSVELSRVFEWFGDDFRTDGKTLADTLAPLLTPEQLALLRRVPPTFLPYDWALNAQPGQQP